MLHQRLPADRRGRLVSIATEQERTLFFDFLPVDLGPVNGFTTRFHLYTVPGQVYYRRSRRAVLQGVDGVVFVADSQPDRERDNLESLDDMSSLLVEIGLTSGADRAAAARDPVQQARPARRDADRAHARAAEPGRAARLRGGRDARAAASRETLQDHLQGGARPLGSPRRQAPSPPVRRSPPPSPIRRRPRGAHARPVHAAPRR